MTVTNKKLDGLFVLVPTKRKCARVYTNEQRQLNPHEIFWVLKRTDNSLTLC
jgi:hypothetical protein